MSSLELDMQNLKEPYSQLWSQGKSYKEISATLGIKFTRAIVLRKKLKLPPRMTSRYRLEGKIEIPLTLQDFQEGMEQGLFKQAKHRAYCVLLYYSAIRKLEGLKLQKENFQITKTALMLNVGERLKHSKTTPALRLPLKAPYMELLKEAVENTKPKDRVFPYSRATGYNIVHRAFKYPHLFRLSRITNFFLEGWTIAQVRSWTGLTLAALEYYVGIADISKMGDKLT